MRSSAPEQSPTAGLYQAIKMAYELHGKQRRKGADIPYMSHLVAVSSLAFSYDASENEAIAALLHDAVEDQGGEKTLSLIRSTFCPEVAEIVEGCTDTDQTPKPPWRPRKEAYIARIQHMSPSVQLVTACDKLHNGTTILRDYKLLGEALWSRFTGGRQTLWYYRSVADTLEQTSTSKRELQVILQLHSVISALEDLAHQ